MKMCNKCSESRQISEYKKDPRNKNGLNGICNICIRSRTKIIRKDRAAGLIELKQVIEKFCNSCNETKSIDNFYKDAGMADGYRTNCKPCKNKTALKWRSENRNRVNEVARIYHAKPENYLRMRLQRYNLTAEQYNQMIKDQDNKCKICFKGPSKDKPLVIDHNHVTSKVRGLLCYGCNRLMVLIDNAELLKRALAYAK